jgi:hypothetical protein
MADFNQILQYERSRYPDSNPVDCVKTDAQIRQLDVRIADLEKQRLSSLGQSEKYTLTALIKLRAEKKASFSAWDCTNFIESKKLIESTNVLSENFEQYDKDVIGKSQKEQTALLVIGSVAILIGLIFILKK